MWPDKQKTKNKKMKTNHHKGLLFGVGLVSAMLIVIGGATFFL